MAVMEQWPTIKLDQYPVLSGDSPEVACIKQNAQEVANIINQKMPELERKIAELNRYKGEYDQRNGFMQWWDNDVMEEKRNEMINVTMNSSDCQLKVVRFIAFLNVILNEQQKCLAATQKEMQTQAGIIETQQKNLECQNEQLAKHQKRMDADNRAVVEGCQILKKLRNAVVEHDRKLDEQEESLTGMDKLLLELRNLYKDFEAYQQKIDKRIKDESQKASAEIQLCRKVFDDRCFAIEKRIGEEIVLCEKAITEKCGERIKDALSKEDAKLDSMDELIRGSIRKIDGDLNAVSQRIGEQCQSSVRSAERQFDERIAELADRMRMQNESAAKRWLLAIVLSVISLVGFTGLAIWFIMG